MLRKCKTLFHQTGLQIGGADFLNLQRKFIIIGEMLELGKSSQNYHRKICFKLVKSSIDKVIFCGRCLQVNRLMCRFCCHLSLLLKCKDIELLLNRGYYKKFSN